MKRAYRALPHHVLFVHVLVLQLNLDIGGRIAIDVFHIDVYLAYWTYYTVLLDVYLTLAVLFLFARTRIVA